MMSVINSGEIRIHGMPQPFMREVAIGRLRLFGNGEGADDRSIVCFQSVESLARALEAEDGRCFSGAVAVVCGCETPDFLLGALCELGMPYFMLPDSVRISRTFEGRLALIDHGRGELIINPQLEALCGCRSQYSERVSHGGVRLSRFLKHPFCLQYDFCGALCESKTLGRDGELLERASELAEALCSSSLAVLLDSPQCESEEAEESFCNSAEALFRAAIYGNMSLILGGVCSYRAARRAFELLHGSFCRLSEEGREFNGYIARGILIESPLLLFDLSRLPKCDLLCFDFSLISARLTGAERGEIPSASRDPLRRFWKTWRAQNDAICRSRELRAICSAHEADDFFWDWVGLMDIKEVYIDGGYNDSFCNA